MSRTSHSSASAPSSDRLRVGAQRVLGDCRSSRHDGRRPAASWLQCDPPATRIGGDGAGSLARSPTLPPPVAPGLPWSRPEAAGRLHPDSGTVNVSHRTTLLSVMRPHRADPPGNAGPCCRSRGVRRREAASCPIPSPWPGGCVPTWPPATSPSATARPSRSSPTSTAPATGTPSRPAPPATPTHARGAGRPDPADLRPRQGRGVLRRLPRLQPRLGARRPRRPLPALRPGQPRCRPRSTSASTTATPAPAAPR